MDVQRLFDEMAPSPAKGIGRMTRRTMGRASKGSQP